ncbi:MAG: pyruvate:ferredoxin (flavodoxin) oxidoreductase, partial [Pseudomonadota bacterium]
FGLSSKDTTPNQMVAVYNNLKEKEPKTGFTVGINDDVTMTSLNVPEDINTVPAGTVECKFYGLGADGTVGANKNSIKIIGDSTDMFAQGYFAYDSKKSGGITVSHLRFGKTQIRSTYLVNNPSFVSCSVPSYLDKYDMLKGIKKGGTFLLNSLWEKNEVVAHLPDRIKKHLAQKEVSFYTINATKIANDMGLGNRTNTVLQSAFFKLANVIPYTDAVKFMKKANEETYGKKGENIVAMNNRAIDMGAEGLIKIDIDPNWKNLKVEKNTYKVYGLDKKTEPLLAKFLTTVAAPVNAMDGDGLPVSAFADYVDGTMPHGTAAFEKRGIAVDVPVWKAENCIQCNQCAYSCPHAVIRPFLLNESELKNSPNALKTLKPIGKGLENLQYKIQISPLDCTGCAICVEVCPAKNKALEMKPLGEHGEEIKNWDYVSSSVTYKDTLMKKDTVKGSQFAQPLFEFSGACSGCGETPYIKLITQLFGERMMIANATGCSSIYGGSAPASPYCKNVEGKGPAWMNSLFEDNAEFGYGFVVAVGKMRERIALRMKDVMDAVDSELKEAMNFWLTNAMDGEKSKEAAAKLVPLLEKESSNPTVKEILSLKDYLVKRSIWVFGGDGWAYDIGYGGLDHVLAMNEDINLLVMDTEVYSNTGGQASKATPVGSIAKFAASGKKTRKKDLGKMAISYGNVYVAQVAMGANQGQYLKAIAEAEAFPGPSLIIAYAPCINHGIKAGGMSHTMGEEKFAVESGYWQMYRYNPLLEKEGKNPFQLDSKEPDWNKYPQFLEGEVRYSSLHKAFPEEADRLFKQSLEDAKWRYNSYKRMAEMNFTK